MPKWHTKGVISKPKSLGTQLLSQMLWVAVEETSSDSRRLQCWSSSFPLFPLFCWNLSTCWSCCSACCKCFKRPHVCLGDVLPQVLRDAHGSPTSLHHYISFLQQRKEIFFSGKSVLAGTKESSIWYSTNSYIVGSYVLDY